MTEVNEYWANQRTYEEILTLAQAIHPDMKVRLTGSDQNEWEMFMPTSYTESVTLSDKYKGTAAWEMFESRDSSYDNALERYRYKNGYSGIPLEGVAEYINLNAEQQKWAGPVQDRLHAENGSAITEEDWNGNLSNEKFMAYTETQRQVGALMEAEYKDKWDAWREKWGY